MCPVLSSGFRAGLVAKLDLDGALTRLAHSRFSAKVKKLGQITTCTINEMETQDMDKLTANIHWHGHDSFRIDGGEVVIYIDPYRRLGMSAI